MGSCAGGARNLHFCSKATNAQLAGAIGDHLLHGGCLRSDQPRWTHHIHRPGCHGLQQRRFGAEELHRRQRWTNRHHRQCRHREIELFGLNNGTGNQPGVQANQLASFSSFGPTPDGAIKPDMVATGGLDIGTFLRACIWRPNPSIPMEISTASTATPLPMEPALRRP